MAQFFNTPAEAVADIPDGVTIAAHIWTLAGTPSQLILAIRMLRSGRIVSMLGALEVSEKGDIANHSLGQADQYSQIGGAMDAAWGAKRVIVCMTHITRDGKLRVLKECGLPVTVRGKANLIISDIAVMEVTPQGLLLKEVAPGWTAQEVQALTGARLTVAPDLTEMTL
jgi:3-oxoacid CoA-transferase subunit B